jgi:hypothetical protein
MLAGTVIIRRFLSFSLEVELERTLAWSRDDHADLRESPAARVMAIDELTRGRWQN